MKKLTKALTLALAVSALTVPTLAGTIGLHINGSKVAPTVAPYQSNGTTLVPLRVVSENLGAQGMTLECGIRFLTDYLDGDNYFRIHYADQNLRRCRTQFKLVSDMEANFDEMLQIVYKHAGK